MEQKIKTGPITNISGKGGVSKEYVDNQLLKKENKLINDIKDIDLGEELIKSQGWSLGSGWSGDLISGFKHTPGTKGILEFNSFTPTPGSTYLLSFYVDSPTGAGIPNASAAFTITIGDSPRFLVYNGGGSKQYTFGLKAINNDSLKIITVNPSEPSKDDITFDGTIKNITMKEIVGENIAAKIIEDSKNKYSEKRVNHKSLYLGLNSGIQSITGSEYNYSLGDDSLRYNTSGFWNTAIGYTSLRDNTTGSRNVGIGFNALQKNICGDRNIAIGTFTLCRNINGRQNIGFGADTLWVNTSGSYNVGIGGAVLGSNTTGSYNIALGATAMDANTTGSNNIALGSEAMVGNVTGNDNIAIGRLAGKKFTGSKNIAIGAEASLFNKDGNNNTVIGFGARNLPSGGNDNTVIGYFAGHGTTTDTNNANTILGAWCGNNITTGSNNVIIGANAGQGVKTSNNNILIGKYADVPDNKYTYINIGNALTGTIGESINFGIGEIPQYIDKTVSLTLSKNDFPTEMRFKTTNGINNKIIHTIKILNNNADIDAKTRPQLFGLFVHNDNDNDNSAKDGGCYINMEIKPKGSFNTRIATIDSNGISVCSEGVSPRPTAKIDIKKASTGQPGTAPIKIKSGAILSSPEKGALEFDGNFLYITLDNGERKKLAFAN